MKIHVLCAFLLASSSSGAATNDWPVYRHDAALTGVSPGKGRILRPEIKWEFYLGAPPVTLATDRKPRSCFVPRQSDRAFAEVTPVHRDQDALTQVRGNACQGG